MSCSQVFPQLQLRHSPPHQNKPVLCSHFCVCKLISLQGESSHPDVNGCKSLAPHDGPGTWAAISSIGPPFPIGKRGLYALPLTLGRYCDHRIQQKRHCVIFQALILRNWQLPLFSFERASLDTLSHHLRSLATQRGTMLEKPGVTLSWGQSQLSSSGWM